MRIAEYTLSSESPRQRSSSMFLVMIRVTSCSSSFSFSIFELAALAVLVSWYRRAVLLINVSAHASKAKRNSISKKYLIKGRSASHQILQMRMAFVRLPPLRRTNFEIPSKARLSTRKQAFVGTTCPQS